MKATCAVVLVLLAVVALTGGALAQAPAVKIGYIASDSFAVLYLMADRYLIPGGINAQLVRLPGGAEITTQVATGQLQVGGAGMGAAGFNAVAAKLPVEFITAKSGLGHLVYRHWQMLSTVEMYGAFVLVGALGLLLTRGLGAIQRRMLAWQEESSAL